MKKNAKNLKLFENNLQFLAYTTKEINRNFKIKVSGTFHGEKYHNYVGVSGLVNIIGLFHTNNFLERAFKLDQIDRCICRLRSGLTVTFFYQ